MSPAAVRIRSEGEPDDHRHRLLRRGSERGERATSGTKQETHHDHRDAPEPVHRPPGREGGQSGGGEEDRRPEAEQRLEARDENERQRGDGGDELEHRRVDRHDRPEEDRVAADREIGGCGFPAHRQMIAAACRPAGRVS
jgi:hypothetical protein